MDLSLILILIVLFGLIFDCTNGFHDVSMVVSSVVATRALRFLPAIIMAGICEIIGATQVGGVARTITTGIVDHIAASELMVLSALIGAIVWNLITWVIAIPSSSSFALMGGMLGSTFFYAGGSAIIWRGVFYKLLCPMVLTPIVGFSVAFFIMRIVGRFYKKSDENSVVLKGAQIFSAGLVSLAHGLNDAQKSMGIITLGLFAGKAVTSTVPPLWVVLSCALTMGFGTCIGGMRMIRTVGYKIKIKPLSRAQGVASDLTSAGIILVASGFGMPVSTTQMIVGSVAGSGASGSGKKSVDWKLVNQIVLAWLLTLPGAALFAVGAYRLLLLLGFSNI